MSGFDERVIAAQRGQLRGRRAVLDGGAAHVGWKVALGIPGADALIGKSPLFGYLTSASELQSGATFASESTRRLQVDCELAVELGRDLTGPRDVNVTSAIAGVGTALELCDVGRPPDDFNGIVVTNVFHRAVIFGRFSQVDGFVLPGRIRVNGNLAVEHDATDPLPHIVGIAQLLVEAGGRLRAGDRIICGAICSAHPGPGDDVSVEVDDLGLVTVAIV